MDFCKVSIVKSDKMPELILEKSRMTADFLLTDSERHINSNSIKVLMALCFYSSTSAKSDQYCPEKYSSIKNKINLF